MQIDVFFVRSYAPLQLLQAFIVHCTPQENDIASVILNTHGTKKVKKNIRVDCADEKIDWTDMNSGSDHGSC